MLVICFQINAATELCLENYFGSLNDCEAQQRNFFPLLAWLVVSAVQTLICSHKGEIGTNLWSPKCGFWLLGLTSF